MTIARLDPLDSVAMGRWYDLVVTVTRHDLPDFPTPSRQEHTARFAHPWPASTEEVLLAWDGDRVVGAASYLLPQAQNLSVVHLDLVVHRLPLPHQPRSPAWRDKHQVPVPDRRPSGGRRGDARRGVAPRGGVLAGAVA